MNVLPESPQLGGNRHLKWSDIGFPRGSIAGANPGAGKGRLFAPRRGNSSLVFHSTYQIHWMRNSCALSGRDVMGIHFPWFRALRARNQGHPMSRPAGAIAPLRGFKNLTNSTSTPTAIPQVIPSSDPVSEPVKRLIQIRQGADR